MKRQKRAETISAQIRQDEPTPDYWRIIKKG
jgi:hypothetical protein